MSRGDALRRVLAAYRGQRRGSATDFQICCPCHEDRTPSCHVSQGREGAAIFCHGCGATGQEVAEALGLDARDLFDEPREGGQDPGPVVPVTVGSAKSAPPPGWPAVAPGCPQARRASEAESAPRSPRASAGAPEPEPVTVALLAERFGLSPDYLRRELGWRDERGGTVTVPYRDETGAELYRKRRVALTGEPKYVHRRGTEQTLYGLDGLPAIRRMRQPTVVFTEGESDFACLRAHGIPALGVPGNTATKLVQADHVRGLRHVYATKDPDAAGEQFVRDLAERLRAVGYDGEPLRVVEMPDGMKDPGELHADDPARFEARFRAACRAAKPVDEDKDLEEAFVSADTIARREVRFLWHPYVPEGKVTFLVGDPGDGKSFMAMAISAGVSTGAALYNGNGAQPRAPGRVLYFVAEDDPEETVVARLADNGATLGQVKVLNLATRHFSFEAQGFDFLRRAVRHFEPALTVFDPLTSFLGAKVDVNNPVHVRQAMQPLVALCQETRATVLIVGHAAKGAATKAVHLVGGNTAWGAVVRSIMATFKDPAAEPGHYGGVVAHAKHNLSVPGPTLRYEIEGTRFYWRGISPLTAQDLAWHAARGGRRGPSLDAACALLREELRDGPRRAREVERAARGSLIGEALLLKARQRLGVETPERGVWRLPASEEQAAEDRAEHEGTSPRRRGCRREEDDGDVPI